MSSDRLLYATDEGHRYYVCLLIEKPPTKQTFYQYIYPLIRDSLEEKGATGVITITEIEEK